MNNNNSNNSFPLDNDLDKMSREELVEELKKLRQAVREHRDATGHDLCWHHPRLWNLLPEKTEAEIAVPAWPEFLSRCISYRKSLEDNEDNERLY